MLLTEALKLITALVVLIAASNFLVRSLVTLSRLAKLSAFSMSFILLAFATTIPELFVGVSSALQGTPELAFGVSIGSNITNLALVAGITIIISKSIPVKGILRRNDTIHMSIIVVLLLLLTADGTVSRADGFILLLSYSVYIYNLLKQKRYYKNSSTEITRKQAFNAILIFLVSTVSLLLSSQFLVESSKNAAGILGVGTLFFGFVVLSLGASIPELAFNINAARKHLGNLALGDLIGSVVNNSTLIIGVTAIITPIQFSDVNVLRVSFIFLITIVLLFNIFARSHKELSTLEGIILIILYLSYISSEYLLHF